MLNPFLQLRRMIGVDLSSLDKMPDAPLEANRCA
jgi:hypothetical protein